MQSALPLHSTHLFVVGLHTPSPASPRQSAFPVHSTHAPVSGLHTGTAGFLLAQVPADTPGEPQPTQVCELPQMGLFGSLQSSCSRQPTHWFVVVLQNPAAAPPSAPPSTPPSALLVQSLLTKHPTHLPLFAHTGAEGFFTRHSLAAELQATHKLPTHTGFVGSAVQSLLFAQATHRPLVGSQTPPPAPLSARERQSLLVLHFAHRKARHKGPLSGQSLSLLQLPWLSTGRLSTDRSATASATATSRATATSTVTSTATSGATSTATPMSTATSATKSTATSGVTSNGASTVSGPATSSPPASAAGAATSAAASTASTQR